MLVACEGGNSLNLVLAGLVLGIVGMVGLIISGLVIARPTTIRAESRQHRLVAIHALLLSMFSGAGLRRFIRLGEQGDAICAQLPGECASLAELVDGVLEQLRQRGLVPGTLARLRDEFPRRLADIDAVANVWAETR